ncbi:MAG: J domain-containing protein [Anaerolineae bacterium]|nr:J domain-containing protein [Anaerolineae bacterium]
MTRRKPVRYDPATDLYTVLGVQPAAAGDDIRRVFRQRAKEVHPDRNPDRREWAHQQFQQLNEAYEVLTSADLRAEYDRLRERYYRDRDVDGVAWWERSNPRRQTGTARSANYRHYERAVWAKHNRRGYRPYHLLFVLSSLILSVSCCAWTMSGNEARDRASVANVVTPACANPNVTIIAPQNGEDVSGHFTILGTAAGDRFVSYRVEIRPINAPTPERLDWMVVAAQLEKTDAVTDGPLAEVLSSQMPSGDYALRLIVKLDSGETLTSCTTVIHYKRLSQS